MSEYDSAPGQERAGAPGETPGSEQGPASSGAGRPHFPWERLFYALGFGFVAWCVFWLLIALAVVQFILLLLQALTPTVTGHPSEELRRFNLRMLQYLLELLAYITFVRDTLPFPFSPFPAAPSQRQNG
jgi:hypothetical protein